MELVDIGLVFSFLGGLAGLTWCALHAFDAIRAWRFNRRMAHARAVAEAYEIGKRMAMGSYAHGVTWVIRTTPDRPITKEQWEAAKAREEIDNIAGREDAVNYPKGS